MKLTVRESVLPPSEGCGKQHTIERHYMDIPEGSYWPEEYVNFGGFFGKLGPHMFAVAPELLRVLGDLVWSIDHGGCISGSVLHEEARALVAKAKGGAA